MLVCSMIRTTITLPDELAAIVTREARRRETSVSEVVRLALGAFLGLSSNAPRRLPFIALGRSGQRHTARDAEKILAAEWGRDRRR
jgi:Arc/MetJ-type ribon-helix-helix transcriptional regulator